MLTAWLQAASCAELDNIISRGFVGIYFLMHLNVSLLCMCVAHTGEEGEGVYSYTRKVD